MKISCRKKAEETLKSFAYYSITEIIKKRRTKKTENQKFKKPNVKAENRKINTGKKTTYCNAIRGYGVTSKRPK